ncbi:MAG: hypothetical protein ACYDC5_00030 [Candidatus Dormibacteria bacterium]
MPRGRPRLLHRNRQSPFAQAARLGHATRSAAAALDPWMVGAIVVLSVLGVLNLVAVGDRPLALRQSISVVLGLAVMVRARRLPSRWWNWPGRLEYGLSVQGSPPAASKPMGPSVGSTSAPSCCSHRSWPR